MASPLYPGRIVKSGDPDPVGVRSVQQRLNVLRCGFTDKNGVYTPIGETGHFSIQTMRAVKLFQSRSTDSRDVPLRVDGQIGPMTWAALFGVDVAVANQAASVLVQAALNVAGTQVGVHEQPALTNSGPQVNQYLKSVGLGPGFNWCAAFLYWCFNEAAKTQGAANPLIRTAGCLDHWHKAGQRGIARIKAKDAQNQPTLVQPGQIFIISIGNGMGHTGLITAVRDGLVDTIEGNTNTNGSRNGIGVFRRQRSLFNINTGFVDYA